eukprot:269494_1
MLWLKLLMWAAFFRAACTGRFMSIFFVDLGLTDSHIGILFGLKYLVWFLSTVFWSYLADKTKKRYLIYQIVIMTSGILSFGMILPHYYFDIKQNKNVLFILMLSSCGIFWCFSLCIFALQDALIILRIDNKKIYGTIRQHGAIAWGIMHITIGVLLDFVFNNIKWMIIMCSTLTIPFLFISYIAFDRKIKNDTNKISDTQLIVNKTSDVSNDDEEKVSAAQFLKFVISKPSTISLYFLMFAVGGTQSVATSLLFPFVFQIGTDKYSHILYTLLGCSVAVTVTFEIPIFRFSEKIIDTMKYKNMIIIGVLCLITRCIGYSVLTANTLWCLVFIEPLHGITYSLIKLCLVNIMYDLFGDKYAATAQGSMSSVQGGLGPLIFVPGAGYVMQYISGQWLYRGVAVFLTFALIIFVISTRNTTFHSHK